MRVLGPADVLDLWERGAHRHALDRSALLCAWARPELAPESVADLPLGTVTSTLMQLFASSFGARIEGHVDCARCGERLALELSVPELLQPDSGDDRRDAEIAGLRVRAPSLRDLAAVAAETDARHAARLLLARCAADVRNSTTDILSTVLDTALPEVESALEAADPNADLALQVHCAACGHRSDVQLDPGTLLWDEIEARAAMLLGEVHTLAKEYGWTEAEILDLSPARRASYLAMVSA